MRIFPASFKKVAKGLRVWVPNYYMPTQFGLRGQYDGLYIETLSPGTGFFVRSGGSRSYKRFCSEEEAKLAPSYKKLLKGENFSFDHEMDRATKAAKKTTDPVKRMLLEAYLKVLPYAKEAEEGEREIEAVRNKGRHHHKLTSYQSHFITNMKLHIAKLEHEAHEVRLSVPDICGEETYQLFSDVVLSFSKVAAGHRLWHSIENGSGLEESFDHVYFDMGIFDFVQAPLMTPMLRDSEGQSYFFYPDFVVRARDGVDFDVFDFKKLSYLYREVPYEMISDLALDSYAELAESEKVEHHRRDYKQFGGGLLVSKDTAAAIESENEKYHERIVAEFYIPELKLRYYARDVRAMSHFVRSLNKFKNR